MQFPKTNRIKQDLNERFGENAILIEEHLKKINWKFYLKLYAALYGIGVASIFVLIISIRVALFAF